MICPGCGKEINDKAAMCTQCGYVFDEQRAMEEYERAQQEYQRQLEEYNRKLEEYNRYQAQSQLQAQVPVRSQPQARMQPQAGPGNVNITKPPTYKKGMDSRKSIIAALFAIAGILVALALILVLVLVLIKNNDNTDGTEDVSTEAADETTEITTEEQIENEYNEDYADYTIMIYMIGSNLESGDSYDYYGIYGFDGGNATLDLDQMAEADIGDNVNVILETGGTDLWINDYGMEGNQVQRFELKDQSYIEKENLGNICMCHENVLEDFLVWGKENYPANNYILVYWDHGCGYTTAAFGYDSNTDEGDTLQISDMATAMKNSGIRFSLTLFNACIMGSVEMASAISSCCDYMIASEESIYTFGMYYTNWMTELSANPDISILELSEIIIDDFVDQYDYYNEEYSYYVGDTSNVTDFYTYELALIDTQKADLVVDKLGEMLINADAAIYNQELTDFLNARENCGDFSGTSSADIIEFCNNYAVEGYEDVIAAVEDAVLYIQSDISYANGLSFYCPEGSRDGCSLYSYDGRINLNNIEFNSNCMTFYDDVLSAYAGYACSENISDLGMSSYYNEELVESYSDTYVDYASNSDYNLDYTYENGKYVLDLGDDFQYVNFLEQRVGYDYEENTAVVLGSDFNVMDWDSSSGVVDVTFPDEWLCVDGQIVCYVVTDHVTSADGSVSMSGIIPFVMTNDYSRLYGMVIQWDSNSGVSVRGYTEIDTEDLTFEDGYMYSMYEGMEIEFCYGVVEHEGNQLDESTLEFVRMGDVHTYNGYGFSIDYDDIDNIRQYLGDYADTAKGYSYVKVYDVFGNEYTTDLVPQE